LNAFANLEAVEKSENGYDMRQEISYQLSYQLPTQS